MVPDEQGQNVANSKAVTSSQRPTMMKMVFFVFSTCGVLQMIADINKNN